MDARLPVHIGHLSPAARDEITAKRPAQRRPLGNGPARQSTLRSVEIDWAVHGLEPRWIGSETSDCVATLEPKLFEAAGDTAVRRFLSGALQRAETALVITVVGPVKRPANQFSVFDQTGSTAVSLSDADTYVRGERLPTGVKPNLAADLGQPDRDLALRLRNSAPDNAPWWGLSLQANHTYSPSGALRHQAEPDGDLCPLLLDQLGAPVAAVWVPSDGSQRCYILPDGFDWNTVLDWLSHQAIPYYNPEAARRHRTSSAVDPSLETQAEAATRQALSEMMVRHAEERATLEQQAADAKAAADDVRDGLFHGTGAVLAKAVGQVLVDAGFDVIDLDEELGATRSADLLATFDAVNVLVEVKSESGRAKEGLVSDLQRHLDTWPQIRPDTPVADGALIVNHERRLPPDQRVPEVYQRREFIQSLKVPVISTRQLFDWWRSGDWQTIRTTLIKTPPPSTAPVVSQDDRQRRRWWQR
ncbi:hypothetical protein [Lentzea sp. NPDC092896]|uniref:hypothetical protein n=1 Tax=Lentzea sp. NPDC092896 TaxID=3364127 RepID=UPI003802D8A1